MQLTMRHSSHPTFLFISQRLGSLTTPPDPPRTRTLPSDNTRATPQAQARPALRALLAHLQLHPSSLFFLLVPAAARQGRLRQPRRLKRAHRRSVLP